MNPSDELKNVMLRLYQSMAAGDIDAVTALFSHEDGVLVIGSDPKERWIGYSAIARAFRTQLREMSGARIELGELSAFVEGTVGWVIGLPKIRLPNGQEVIFRETDVFHLEDGEWKIVLAHDSIGMPNEETIGKGLSLA